MPVLANCCPGQARPYIAMVIVPSIATAAGPALPLHNGATIL
jgi:hypothetical protein